MFNNLKRSSLIFWSLEILILMGIIWLGTKVSFLFSPLEVFASAVFVPVLIAGILYYLLNPVVKLLTRVRFFQRHLSRTVAVILVFLVILLLLYYLATSFLPHIIEQISNLVRHLPRLSQETRRIVIRFADHHSWLQKLPVKSYVRRLQDYVTGNAKVVLSRITMSLSRLISMATNVIVDAITVPVILFYMLKDGDRLRPALRKLLPVRHQERVVDLISKMSQTISKYIGGQMIECLFVGAFTSLGYLLIHQKYAFLLGIFAGICNIMPYIGPYIGIIPSLLVALTVGIPQLIYVVIVVIIVQQIDGNLVYPNVIGKSLQIHPLTIIIILLAAGHLAGLLGMILAIPLYAVIKVVVQYIYNIYLVRNKDQIFNK